MIAAGFMIYPPVGVVVIGVVALSVAYVRRLVVAWERTQSGSE
jgi:hypothetical protein